MYYNDKRQQINKVRNYVLSASIIVQVSVLVKNVWAYLRTFGDLHKKGGAILSTLYNRITELCKTKGVTGSRMCLDLGMSKSILSDIKNGRKRGISTATAQKMAAYLDVSVDVLLGEDDEIKKEQPTEYDGLSEKRKALIDFALSVPDDKAEMILRVMKSIVESD